MDLAFEYSSAEVRRITSVQFGVLGPDEIVSCFQCHFVCSYLTPGHFHFGRKRCRSARLSIPSRMKMESRRRVACLICAWVHPNYLLRWGSFFVLIYQVRRRGHSIASHVRATTCNALVTSCFPSLAAVSITSKLSKLHLS